MKHLDMHFAITNIHYVIVDIYYNMELYMIGKNTIKSLERVYTERNQRQTRSAWSSAGCVIVRIPNTGRCCTPLTAHMYRSTLHGRKLVRTYRANDVRAVQDTVSGKEYIVDIEK